MPRRPRLRIGLALAASAVWVPLAPAPAQVAGAEVVILSPQLGQPIFGRTRVSFLVSGVDERDVERAEILLDGRRVATIETPPWRVEFDSGDVTGSRALEVVVHLAGGRTLRARRISRPLAPATQVDVRLVSLAATVVDSDGRPVLGLTRDAFRVYDDGQPVAISRFDPSPGSLAVAVVLDVSASMQGDRIRTAREAAVKFIEQLDPRDDIYVLAFSDRVRLLAGPEASREERIAAIRGVRPKGGTALYDAVYEAADRLSGDPSGRRRVMVLLSDGRDEAASGLEPGSFHTLEEAVRKAHRHDVIVFSLGLGSRLDRELDFNQRLTTAEVLTRLAASTGGTFEPVRRPSRLARAFGEVLDELRHQYVLAYSPPAPKPGQSWRSIRVTVDVPGASVRTREGYFVD